MKWMLWVLIFLAFAVPIVFIGKGVDHLDVMKERYKRAIDAGADAAVKYHSYDSQYSIKQISQGYGEGFWDKENIVVDKDGALFWFYEVLFRNLGIENDEAQKLMIRKYIPMKAIAAFDRLIIADANDDWIVEKLYEVEFSGDRYILTMSDKVLRLSTGEWKRDIDYGITAEKRKQLLASFIRENLNSFLNNRESFESGLYYDVNITISEIDSKADDIEGISFIALIEGLPLPSLNPKKQEKFYAFSLGGSELSR